MRAPGSFHPKIILLAGEKKGLVLVGSHNMTISGISVNREITTHFDVRTTDSDNSLALACDVWSFIEEWVEHQRDKTPGQLLEAVSAIRGWPHG
jgi:phosphatidylserine/phosphatidylglycerophosphate/cardiolipin synthase-like enzyme